MKRRQIYGTLYLQQKSVNWAGRKTRVPQFAGKTPVFFQERINFERFKYKNNFNEKYKKEKEYPAIFLKEDDGRYLVSFSDVPKAITCGNDFENLDIKETVVKIELNLTGLDDKKTNFIIIKKSNESVKLNHYSFTYTAKFLSSQ